MAENRQAVVVSGSTPVTKTSRQVARAVEEHSLTTAEVQKVTALVAQYKTNVVTINSMLVAGLTVKEAEDVLEAREYVNDGLRTPMSAEHEQQMSIKGYLRLRRFFPELPTDPEALAETLLHINEQTQKQYFSIVLDRLIDLRMQNPDLLIETLVAMLTGEFDI